METKNNSLLGNFAGTGYENRKNVEACINSLLKTDSPSLGCPRTLDVYLPGYNNDEHRNSTATVIKRTFTLPSFITGRKSESEGKPNGGGENFWI